MTTWRIWICDECRKCFDEKPIHHGAAPPNAPYQRCSGVPTERLLVELASNPQDEA